MVLHKNIITTINTSDDQINMKDYAYIVSKNEIEMAKEVEDILKKDKKVKRVDFKEIQKNRIKQFEEIFNS